MREGRRRRNHQSYGNGPHKDRKTATAFGDQIAEEEYRLDTLSTSLERDTTENP